MAEQAPGEIRALPIEWHIPPDLISRPATNIVVQHSEHEFTISFFEIRKPILVGPREQQEALLEQTKSVPMICVARVIVSAGRMPEFVRALQLNLERHQSTLNELKESIPKEPEESIPSEEGLPEDVG